MVMALKELDFEDKKIYEALHTIKYISLSNTNYLSC
jgi:hypothetical protein